jgi:hypothetical protein
LLIEAKPDNATSSWEFFGKFSSVGAADAEGLTTDD